MKRNGKDVWILIWKIDGEPVSTEGCTFKSRLKAVEARGQDDAIAVVRYTPKQAADRHRQGRG